jgi:hypothetical protein
MLNQVLILNYFNYVLYLLELIYDYWSTPLTGCATLKYGSVNLGGK